jgi:hypothetical protein
VLLGVAAGKREVLSSTLLPITLLESRQQSFSPLSSTLEEWYLLGFRLTFIHVAYYCEGFK